MLAEGCRESDKELQVLVQGNEKKSAQCCTYNVDNQQHLHRFLRSAVHVCPGFTQDRISCRLELLHHATSNIGRMTVCRSNF